MKLKLSSHLSLAAAFIFASSVVWAGSSVYLNHAEAMTLNTCVNDSPTDTGCFTQTWKAAKVFGLYRYGGDTGQLDDNDWVSAVGVADGTMLGPINGQSILVGNTDGRTKPNPDDNKGPFVTTLYRWYGSNQVQLTGALDARAPMIVTEWQVTGRVK